MYPQKLYKKYEWEILHENLSNWKKILLSTNYFPVSESEVGKTVWTGYLTLSCPLYHIWYISLNWQINVLALSSLWDIQTILGLEYHLLGQHDANKEWFASYTPGVKGLTDTGSVAMTLGEHICSQAWLSILEESNLGWAPAATRSSWQLYACWKIWKVENEYLETGSYPYFRVLS